MSVASEVFIGLEAASENGTNTQGVKIVRRDKAACAAFGSVTDTERDAYDLFRNNCIAERTAPLKILEVRPGESVVTGFAAPGCGQHEQTILMSDCRIRMNQDAFNPAKDCCIGADSQYETQDRQG